MGEARLVEIMEGVCGKSDEKCFEFLSDYEEMVEEWWAAREGGDYTGLEKHFCTDEAKVCCAAGAFGVGVDACLNVLA